MTVLNISLNIEDLKSKIENSNLDVAAKAGITLILNKVMESERDDYIQAKAYERNEERTTYRNGYYERELVMSIGALKLCVPRTRDGEFSTHVFKKYKRYDQALVASMIEMVVNGVSTRKVTRIVEEICGKSVSKSLVSELTKELDPIVNEWRNRPLNVHSYKYIIADALYIKVRENNIVVSKGVFLAIGINELGNREIIGLEIYHTESHESWSRFFQSLKNRGLNAPDMIISDAHAGLKSSIKEHFVRTQWQRCYFHFKKNIVDALPKKALECKMEMRQIFEASTAQQARERKNEFIKKYEQDQKLEKSLRILDDGFEDAIQYYAYNKNHHTKLRTSNMVERVNCEIRRREKVIRIFPNDQSAIRIIGAVLMDIDEEWLKKKRYLKLN